MERKKRKGDNEVAVHTIDNPFLWLWDERCNWRCPSPSGARRVAYALAVEEGTTLLSVGAW